MEEWKRKEIMYRDLVMAHIAKKKKEAGKKEITLPFIEDGTPEWAAWLRYFNEHLGFVPFAMKRIMGEKEKYFTVPDHWPWDFDASYPEPRLIGAS